MHKLTLLTILVEYKRIAIEHDYTVISPIFIVIKQNSPLLSIFSIAFSIASSTSRQRGTELQKHIRCCLLERLKKKCISRSSCLSQYVLCWDTVSFNISKRVLRRLFVRVLSISGRYSRRWHRFHHQKLE